MFEELKQIQGKNGGFDWALDLNGTKHNVTFKLAVQVIIGDCKGHDVLCGRYASHSILVKQLCRDCKVSTLDGDDPFHCCKWRKRSDIVNKTEKQMNDQSFYWIKNAFAQVDFGCRSLNITEVTPPEPLHVYKLGLCSYLFEGLEKQAAPKTMRLINLTVMSIAKCAARSKICHCFMHSKGKEFQSATH